MTFTSPAKAGVWNLTAANFGSTSCTTSDAAAPIGLPTDTHVSPAGTHTTAEFAWVDPWGWTPNRANAYHQFTITGSVESLTANDATADAIVTAAAMNAYSYEKHLFNNGETGFHNPVPTGTLYEGARDQPITYHPFDNSYTANVDISFYLKTEAKAQVLNPGGSATASAAASNIETTGISLDNAP